MSGTEQWLPVLGWEGLYEVSDTGRVKSLARTVTAARRGGAVASIDLPTRVLAGSRLRTGHITVALSRDGRRHMRYVHRLVLEAFVGPATLGLEGCHYNGDGSDNRLENLRWDTRSANHLDKVRHGNNQFANRTHCPRGHEYSDGNTYRYPNGARACRICRRSADRLAQERRRNYDN